MTGYKGSCWDTGLGIRPQQIAIVFGSSVRLYKWSNKWIFYSGFPKFRKMPWNPERGMHSCSFKKGIKSGGKAGCYDCWHLWPAFICVRGGLASLWLQLPWRGSGGGLPGLPASQWATELLLSVTSRGWELRCASTQIMRMADLPWLVMWLCTYPWVWCVCAAAWGSLCDWRRLCCCVFPPFDVIPPLTRADEEFKQLNQMWTLFILRN